jgi:hypothetical protein
MVQSISVVTQHDIRLMELTEAKAREQWQAKGFPDEVVDFFV